MTAIAAAQLALAVVLMCVGAVILLDPIQVAKLRIHACATQHGLSLPPKKCDAETLFAAILTCSIGVLFVVGSLIWLIMDPADVNTLILLALYGVAA